MVIAIINFIRKSNYTLHFYCLVLLLSLFLNVQVCLAESPSIVQLLQLTQAGASIELDLRDKHYSASELVRLASSLKFEATLTLIVGSNSQLSVSQCVQIAKSAPGHVIFRF